MATDSFTSDGFSLNTTFSPSKYRQLGLVAIVFVATCAAMSAGFWMGQQKSGVELPRMLAATAASSDTMAVATGAISSDAEGIFFLDFITGDLQCLVYYPRVREFRAYFVGNVGDHLGGAGKNSKYLLVTGQAVSNVSSGGPRPGASLVYVTDVNSGMFAAYAVPWDRNAESSGRPQSGLLHYVGGGPIRNYQLPNAQNQPAAVIDPNKNKP